MNDKADPGLLELWVPVVRGTASLESSYLVVPTPYGTWLSVGIGASSDGVTLDSRTRTHEWPSRKSRH